MSNYPEFVYSLIAGTTIGAIMVPIDPRNRGDRLKFLLNNCGAKAVIVSADCLEFLEEIIGDVRDLKLVSVAYSETWTCPCRRSITCSTKPLKKTPGKPWNS